MSAELEDWEGEGGATLAPPLVTHAISLIGTPSQVEWGERIRQAVAVEFDRVAASFRSIAEKQHQGKREETEEILAILEEKRAEVMKRDQAGYFIHGWQDISDQVRKLIGRDPRYLKIRERRSAFSTDKPAQQLF